MLSYKNWKLLKESLGTVNLGLSQKQSLGITSNLPLEEMPMDMDRFGGGKFGKPKFGGKPDMGKFGDEEEELGDEEEELGDEEMELGDEEEKLGDEEEELGDEEEELGDEEMGDGGEEFGDDQDAHFPKKRKPMMGNPHDSSAFMGYMKGECACDDKDGEMGDEEEGDKLLNDKKKIEFLSKKSKKMKKKMKEETTNCDYYQRPKQIDNSDEAFLKSLANQYGKTDEKFFDGVSEDVLLPPADPQPGEVGWAPTTRIGAIGGQEVNVGESIDNMMKKIAKLEEQLKSKE